MLTGTFIDRATSKEKSLDAIQLFPALKGWIGLTNNEMFSQKPLGKQNVPGSMH